MNDTDKTPIGLNRKDILFILPRHAFEYQQIEKAGFRVIEPYTGNKVLFRIFREVCFRCNLSIKLIWYNSKVNIDAKIIIVYEPLMIPDFIRWLHMKNPKSRIILAYVNPVKGNIDPKALPDDWCEKVSCDPEDCTKYGLRLVQGGYFRHYKVNYKQPIYDVFFIGRDKNNRAKRLFQLKEEFEHLGLRTNFYITADRSYKRFNKSFYKPLISYDKVLEMLGETRSILHLVDGGQTGVTYRVFESLFHGIKLITDNDKLIEYDFYHPDNIFILGKDDLSTLPAFLEQPYKKINESILKKYDFEASISLMLGEDNT